MTRPKRPSKPGSARGGKDAKPAERPRPDAFKPRPKLPHRAAPQLNAPPPGAVFRDRDGQELTFPDSSLKRVAARLLSERGKAWRYRPFPFPLFTDKGQEQTFHFDFYVYDNQEAVIRLILVVPRETRELWDRVGRFKRQYPMYHYELWTPEKLADLLKPRAQLGF